MYDDYNDQEEVLCAVGHMLTFVSGDRQGLAM
jgi:hypothetical protein